jgi:hypothetical protein
LTDGERARIEETLQRQVITVQHEIEVLLIQLGYRIDIASTKDGYYWDNCRDVVIRIKNLVNTLPEWMRT